VVETRRVGAGLVAARIGAALLLGAASVAVLRPFLTPITWAAIVAYVTWPLYRRLRDRSKRPRLAAGLFTCGVALGIGGPVALILAALANDATSIVQAVQEWRGRGSPLPDWITQQPWFEAALERLRALPLADPTRLGEWLARAGGEVSVRLVAIAGGIARNAFKFAVMLVALFTLYVNGERLADAGHRLVPLLFPAAPERFFERIGNTVQGVVFGLLGTALVQGFLAGVGLAVAGVPSVVALSTATALCSFVPAGSSLVTLLAAVWLGVGGRLLAAVLLAAWGLLVVANTDNILRPLLISGRAQIPFLLVFLGVIGGLTSFGLLGLFLGPVLLSVAFTLATEFMRVQGAVGAAEAPAKEA
jgi:predicted PurR-regulated permease PerM